MTVLCHYKNLRALDLGYEEILIERVSDGEAVLVVDSLAEAVRALLEQDDQFFHLSYERKQLVAQRVAQRVSNGACLQPSN